MEWPDAAAVYCRVCEHDTTAGQASVDSYLPPVAALADSFADVLRDWLTPAQFAEMQARNRSSRDAGESGVCASHDFCDANMAMSEAFDRAGWNEDRRYTPDESGLRDDVTHRWNEAWADAIARHLTAAAPVDPVTAAARKLLEAFGGNVPDWLGAEVAALENAMRDAGAAS